MKRFGTILGGALIVTLLSGLLAGGYVVAVYFANAFALLEPQARAVAAIGSAVVLLAASVIAQAAKGRRVEGSDPARAPTYECVLSVFCGHSAPGDHELLAIERALALHGSAKVISAYARLRELAGHGADAEARAMLLKSLLLEMRRDLGRTDFAGLPAGAQALVMTPDSDSGRAAEVSDSRVEAAA